MFNGGFLPEIARLALWYNVRLKVIENLLFSDAGIYDERFMGQKKHDHLFSSS